ncbi:hypothetical protein HB803_13855 [Listeria welshimeri]|nr:hypothetical protein [Listeria welshimeri]
MGNQILKEKMLLFLYAISNNTKNININTFQRYLYLYFVSDAFLNKKNTDTDVIIFSDEKSGVRIEGYAESIEGFQISDFIDTEGITIIIKDELRKYLQPLVESQKGLIIDQYKEIVPFVNLLSSYDEDFLFTILFSEPTIEAVERRQLETIDVKDNKLIKLLNDFKEKITNKDIDEYDILSHWMDFIIHKSFSED